MTTNMTSARLLARLGEADSVPAAQVLQMVVAALKDSEYGLPGLPGPAKPEFGYDLQCAADRDTYVITVTNCAGASLEKLRERAWRHEAVHDIVVVNHGPGGDDRKGVTIDITMFRVAARAQGRRVWSSGDAAPVAPGSVVGLVVPDESRRDALAIISALRAHARDTWEPAIGVAEETAARTPGCGPGFRLDAQPLAAISLSFYAHLDELLGGDDANASVLRNIVALPCVFNGGQQHALLVNVYCRGRPTRPAKPGRDAAVRSRRDQALHATSSSASSARRSSSWWHAAARALIGSNDE